MTATAIVFTRPHAIDRRDVPLPQFGPTSVRVATHLTSVSAGTERMTLGGRLPGMPQLQYPLIPGYETVGEVVEIGDAVTDFSVGDRVFLPGTVGYQGIYSVFGGQISESVNDDKRPIKLPGEMPNEIGLLLALSATAHHGVRRCFEEEAKTSPDTPLKGKSVLVLGCGVVGQLAARMLADHGAAVSVADVLPSRLEKASDFEKYLVGIDPKATLPANAFDIVIEATGKEELFDVAVGSLKKFGLLLVLGFYSNLGLTFGPSFIKEITMKIAGQWNPENIEYSKFWLTRNAHHLSGLFTHRLPAEDPRQAFDTALSDPDCLKIAMTW